LAGRDVQALACPHQRVGRWFGIGQDVVEERALQGERRAQLVRGVDDELALGSKRSLEACQEVVEGVSELFELIVRPGEVESPVVPGRSGPAHTRIHRASASVERCRWGKVTRTANRTAMAAPEPLTSEQVKARERWQARWTLPILLAALVPLFLTSPKTRWVQVVVGLGSWLVFLVDLIVQRRIVRDYLRRRNGRLDLAIVLLRFPIT
jgi:hypothetical protein